MQPSRKTGCCSLRRRSQGHWFTLAWTAIAFCSAGCGGVDQARREIGYRAQIGDLEVFALTPPVEFVGRAPAMSPEREAQEVRDAQTRAENPRFFALTEPPPAGTRAVAEFEPVDAVYVAVDPATESFAVDLLRAVLPVAPAVVTLTEKASPERLEAALRAAGVDRSRLRVLGMRHDTLWTRDFGPVSVELPDGRPAFLDFRYPQTRVLDDGIPSALAELFQVPVYRTSLRMESGVFMTNGRGLCVTTTSLAVGNQDLTFDDLAVQLQRLLGCRQLVFLESPRDEVTGHVDMIAKFTQRDTILMGSFDAAAAPEESARMDRNAELLASVSVSRGRCLNVVRMPMPPPDGAILRSTTNSLLVNGLAIVPTYGDTGLDASVLEAYLRALPDGWRVTTVDASSAIELGGAIHCAALGLRIAPR